MRDEILELLRSRRNDFVSGQAMSETCHVSRTAIWKHIEILRKRGYVIESSTKKGYRLLDEPDVVSADEMKKVLKTQYMGHRYVYMDRVESTNTIAKSIAFQGAEEGTIVCAEEQADGRGRLNRGWYSPYSKGLWFSLILRPNFLPQEAPKCTLMAAVALTKAFHRLGLTSAQIKWPNDILVGNKKLVGILTEMNGSMEEISYIVMGIGINLLTLKEELPEEIKDVATSFAIEGVQVDRRVAFNEILLALEEQYEKVKIEGFDSTLEEWKTMAVTLGKEVTVKAPGGNFFGVAKDIDMDGNLLIEREDGRLERVIAGDVSIRPRHGGGY